MKNVAIITGGDSAEYDISLLSADTVLKNLDRNKFNPYLIEIKNGIWKIKIDGKFHEISKDLFIKVKEIEMKFDHVFMALHGPPGENGDLQIILEQNNIYYTCCDAKVSKLTFNKYDCNQHLRKLGYNIADSVLLKEKKQNLNYIKESFKTPFIVKPNQAGSSNGISLVKDLGELENAINIAFNHDNEVIIEKFIAGTEVSCGVFKIKGEIITLPITEIVSENDFFDYEAKYHNKSKEITPARISQSQTNQIHEHSKKIYQDLNLRGMCRIDFIISQNKPYVIEVNTIPGLSEKSIMPQQLKKAGYNLKEVFTICLEN